ncbi:hypothetical protein GX50_08275 [[Emmonsia] crescens]|uniref:Uncharacterized protein n=1 Tax=[Emmonsia] crescens TaxID=73230 RepID=A0A2B7Z6X9_9EURO|nr:hypothetical protein GX50_08275 [Emmonsia crescens]
MKFSIVNVLVSGLLLAAAGVNACQCREGTRQGQYCGHCSAVLVTPDFVYDHVAPIEKADDGRFLDGCEGREGLAFSEEEENCRRASAESLVS